MLEDAALPIIEGRHVSLRVTLEEPSTWCQGGEGGKPWMTVLRADQPRRVYFVFKGECAPEKTVQGEGIS